MAPEPLVPEVSIPPHSDMLQMTAVCVWPPKSMVLTPALADRARSMLMRRLFSATLTTVSQSVIVGTFGVPEAMREYIIMVCR